MSRRPPVHELEFLKLTNNHRKLSRELRGIDIDTPDILEYALYICERWFKLAEQHLEEAEKAFAANCTRAVFSRSYYAAYNASKAIRYIVDGWVSMKGDDHQKAAPGLPKDLPNVAELSENITTLYEHRLRADYDNWHDMETSETITPNESIQMAKEFIGTARTYIEGKFEVSL